MMEIFELAIHGWDGSSQWLFYQEGKTKEDFEKDVKHLLKTHGEAYLKQEESFAGNTEWCRFILPILEKIGYVPITTSMVSFSELIIIRDRSGYEHENKKWEEAVGADLMKAAFKHNKNLDRRLK